MKKQLKFVSLATLTILVGCNEDVGRANRTLPNKPETTTPGIETSVPRIRSMLHRAKGAAQLTYDEEITKTLNGTLNPSLYRTIPLMETDDEGSSRNVTMVSTIGRPATPCGTGTFLGINARIADCQTKNGERASWNGSSYGASGEGSWSLVTKSENKEIWMDQTTGMVWSYLIVGSDGKNLFNWCKASGNFQGGTPTEQINCTTESISLCDGQTLPEVGSQVKWRLPTRNDYLQADLNGLRFVLTRENDQGLWTATMRAVSVGRTEAWVYSSKEGTLSAGNLTSERYVRCIGAPQL